MSLPTYYDTSLFGPSEATGGNADALKTTGAPVVVSGSNPPTIGQALVATSPTTAVWTDISVPLVDNLTFITDAATPSNRIGFNATGAGNTTLTLTSNTSANRAITFPDATDTLVARNTIDTLANKTLLSPIISNIINGPGSNVSIPANQVTQLVGRNTLDIMTNKTLGGSSNFVAANYLKVNPAGSPIIDLTLGTAPPGPGYTLKTVSTTRADWSPETVTTLSNQGTNSLVHTSVGPNIAIKGIQAGTGIQITSGANDLTISSVTNAILDSQFTILDSTNNTRTFKVDVGGSVNTLQTLATAQTVNRSTFLPDADGILVTRDDSVTMSNKTFIDDSFAIRDQADSSIKLKFDASGSTFTETLIRANQSDNRVIELPDASDTLVGRDTLDTLTNKTLNDASNLVAANELRTAGTNVALIGVNPVPGYVLKAVTANSAQWLPENNSTTVLDSTFAVVDATDQTKRINFNTEGTTGTTTTLLSSQTVNRTLTLPDATDSLVARATTETLSNKSLVAANTSITDLTTPTKRITFDCVNNQPNMRTILSTRAVIANQIIEFPATTSTDTVVTNAFQANLTNKTLDDASVLFRNNVQSSRTVRFSVSNTANNTQLTISTPITASRTIIIPDVSDTLVTRITTDTLFSKTITDATNNVAANSLKTTGASVTVSTAAPPTAGQSLVATSATTAAWSNPASALIDTTTFIVDNVDATKRIAFDAAGSTGTTTTLLGSQTANRILTLPDISDTLVTRTAAETLTNKNFNEASCFFTDNSFPSVRIGFQVGGSAGTTSFLASTQTADRTLLLPDISDTIVTKTSTDIFANKTITAASNIVEASQLRTTGAAVIISAAAPPSVGQILKATSATAASWQNDAAGTPATLSSLGSQTSLIGSTNAPDALAVKSLQAGDRVYLDTSVTDVIKIHEYGSSVSVNKPVSDTQTLYQLHGKTKYFYLQNTNASNLGVDVILPLTSSAAVPTSLTLRVGDEISITSAPGSVNFINVIDPENASLITQIFASQTKTFFARSSGAGGYVVSGTKGDSVGVSGDCIVFGSGHLNPGSTNTISLKSIGAGTQVLTSCISIGASTFNNATSTQSIAVGHLAASGGTIGNNLIAIGCEASKTSADQFSVSLGYRAGLNGIGDASICIGREVCRDVKSLAGSISIGRLANESVAAGVSSISIGDRVTNSQSNAIVLGSLCTALNPNDVVISNDVTFAGLNGRSLFIQGTSSGQVPSGCIILGVSNAYPNSTTPNNVIIIGKSNSLANQTAANGGDISIYGRGNTIGTALLSSANVNVYGSANTINNDIIGSISIFGSNNLCQSQSGPGTVLLGIDNDCAFGSNVLVGFSNSTGASSSTCVAIGRGNVSATQGINNFPSVSIGASNTANALGGGAIAIGFGCSSTAQRGVAIGFQAQAKSICSNLPQILACKAPAAINQSDAHMHFANNYTSYTTIIITGTGTFDFTIGNDNLLMFMPVACLVANTGGGSGNVSFSVGTPTNTTQYRNDGATGLLLGYQCFNEVFTPAKTQNVRSITQSGNSTLRITISAWSQTLTTFQPRISISGYAYQL